MIFVWAVDKRYSGYCKISIESYKWFNPSAKCIVVSEEPLPKDMGYDENWFLDNYLKIPFIKGVYHKTIKEEGKKHAR